MKHSYLPSLRRSLLAFALTFAFVSQLFGAHPSDLDLTFGTYQRNFGGNQSQVTSIQIVPDGSYYFPGFADFSPDGTIFLQTLEKYFPGDLPNPGSGDAPCRTWGQSPFLTAAYESSVLQPDGKLLVAGTLYSGQVTPMSYFVVRCNADRTLDTLFNGTGMISGPFGPQNYQSRGVEVLRRPDGKVILVGSFKSTSPAQYFAAVQFNSDGTPDTSFGQGGTVLVPFSGEAFATSAALQSDGKLVISGGVGGPSVLVRLQPNGSTDLSFGQQGIQQTNMPGGQGATPYSIKLLPNGTLLVVGGTSVAPDLNFFMTRHEQNGALDPSFGANGVVLSAFSGFQADLDVMPNGKILACGRGNNFGVPLVARYYPNGKIDRSFGTGGTIGAERRGAFRAIKVQDNGRFIAAGYYTGSKAIAVPLSIAFRYRGGERAETVRFDFDGDGQADISGFRPSNGNWTLLRSGAGNIDIQWGLASDTLVPADYDGDGKTNVAIYRNGAWKIILADGSYQYASFGQTGDLPRPGDFDGDGKADIAFWRPANGTWNWVNSSDGHYKIGYFGTNGDVPLIADIDGDGITDQAVFRPSNGDWYFLRSTDGQYGAVHFGATGDIPVVGDFDGDGKTDLSVYRPSNGYWYRLNSSNGQFVAQQFGTNGDVPVAADYDGDNHADIAVYRPSNNIWYILNSGNGITYTQYGLAGDRPLPAVFLP